MQRTQRRNLFNESNPLVMLIALNLILFVILHFIQIAYLLGNSELYEYQAEILHHFTLPGKLSELIVEPWTFFTHFFVHHGIWQLIGNMLFLWGFGFLLQDLSGEKHTAPLYLYGGWIGAAFWMLALNLIPKFAAEANILVLSGGGAAVMAIAAATTMLAPQYRVFPLIGGGIPLWIITLVYVLVDFAGMTGKAFPFHLSHLCGAGAGVMYIVFLKKGWDLGAPLHRLYHSMLHLFSSTQRRKQHLKAVKDDLFYQAKGIKPFEKKPNITQKRIDALLDKINQQGLESLTDEEKDFLKKASSDQSK
jgi:membrane associated rhomboid family serine protease